MTNKFIEQRVEALENELSELKLIVAQIRKPSTVVEEALANDIIEFEGKQYKKVDREAREGDVVICKNQTDLIGTMIENNVPYKVGKRGDFERERYIKIYEKHHNRTTETVDVYELMDGYNPGVLMVDETPVKTANQLRAEIIEKAKGFVEKIKIERVVNHKKALVYVNRKTLNWVNAEFIVNEEKRTIVCLIRWTKDNTLDGRGVAKCMPGDVFNEHIGKAIALGRALGLDVSEFERAVQPTLAVGQNVYFSNEHGLNVQYEIVSINENSTLNLTITKDYENNELFGADAYFLNTRDDVKPVIINDTNAQYGGVE